jgi:hypothetical protein
VRLWQDYWSGDLQVMYEHEREPFNKYFGSIEVLNRQGDLVRVFFPIITECRQQMSNPLVLNEMVSVMEKVKRDSPEVRHQANSSHFLRSYTFQNL